MLRLEDNRRLRKFGRLQRNGEKNGNEGGSSTISAGGRGDSATKDGSDSSSSFVFSLFPVL